MQKLKYIINSINKFLLKQHNIYALFIILLVLPNCFLIFSDNMSWAIRMASLFIPLGVYMLLLSLRKRPGIIMLFLIFLIFLSCVQYTIIYLFGTSIIASDMFLNLFIGNPGEANELLSSLLPMIIIGVFVIAATLWLTYRSITIENKLSQQKRKNMLSVAMSFLMIGLLCAGIQRYKVRDDYALLNIYPINVFYNMQLAYLSIEKNNNYAETSKSFKYDALSTHNVGKREIYILVIGETSRASSWGLYGYERQTTPQLSTLDSLIVYNDVTAICNTTFKCIPMIITSVDHDDYNLLYYHKSIITAFKEAGFKTCYFSNQSPTGTYIDYYATEADTTLYLNNSDNSEGHPYDHELLPHLKAQISEGDENLFVLLHTYGSHFSYSSRYTQEFQKYTPDNYTSLDYSQREPLVNAYDNSILATDNFLYQVIDILKNSQTIGGVLYLSDHGEDLMDDRYKRSLHSSPYPSYNQLHIPMLLWLSNQYAQAFPYAYKCATQYSKAPISSQNVFHTMIDMAGIQTQYLNAEYSLINPQFRVYPRYFLDDHNQAKRLKDCGLKAEDKEMFLKQGLQFP